MSRVASADWIAHELARLQKQIRTLQTQPQLPYSSIDINGEAVLIPDGIRSGIEAKDSAEQAEAAAAIALASANGKNTINYSAGTPTAGYTGTVGDTWFRRDANHVIIGQWEWDGAAWQPKTVGSQVIASLDVGKLTAGTAAIDTGVISKLRTDIVTVGSVPPAALAGGTDELIPNPRWMDPAGELNYAPHRVHTSNQFTGAVDATGWSWAVSNLRFGQPHVLFINHAVTPASYQYAPVGPVYPAQGGEKFYVAIDGFNAGGTTAAEYVVFGLRCWDANGATLTTPNVRTSGTAPNVTWVTYSDVLTLPDGTAKFQPFLQSHSSTAVGSTRVGALSVRRIMAGASESGQRVEISPQGVRMWGADDEGEPSVDLTTSGANTITLRDPADDRPLVVLDNQGGISGKEISADEEFYYQGDRLPAYLDSRHPLGVIGRGTIRASMLPVLYNSEVGLFRISFPMRKGRLYQINVNHAMYQVSGSTVNGTVGYRMRYTADPDPVPTGTSPILNYVYRQNVGNGLVTLDWQRTVYGNEGQWFRVLVCLYNASGGNVRLYGTSNDLTYTVTDLGATVTDTATLSTGGLDPGDPTPPTPPAAEPTRYTKTYSASWWQSYFGDGSQVTSGSAMNGKVGQGYTAYYPAGGQHRGMWGFSTAIATDLAGATVEKVEFYAYAEHWTAAAGGTGAFYGHGNTSKPATFTSPTNGTVTAPFKRGQGKWITLPESWHSGFKSGANRGITAYSSSNSPAYYGYFTGSTAKLRITYTK